MNKLLLRKFRTVLLPKPDALKGDTMEYKNDLFGTENIPDFAMQPAKPAEEFDPTVYDKLYEAMTKPLISRLRKKK